MDAKVVLGVDPSLRGTGWGVVELGQRGGSPYRCLGYGVIRQAPTRSVARCLLEIEETLAKVIAEHGVTLFSIESTIFVQSYATAISLGAARGAALIAAERHGLEVHEFAPKNVKQAVVGRGGASKQQVAFMVRSLCGLDHTPPSDACDALAVGIALLHKLSNPLASGGR